MVIRRHKRHRKFGALMIEVVVAMAIFVTAFVPVTLVVAREHRAARLLYNRAVAGEILDGELEVLLAGDWRALTPGTRAWSVSAEATNSLPPGRFQLSFDGSQIRLEWAATKPQLGGHVAREARLPIR